MTHEEFAAAFKAGAEAMQGRIVAYLMMKGKIEIAPAVLALTPPEPQEPEHVVLEQTR